MPLIKFRFEGLFTFVVRRNSADPAMPNGVYALMPETKTFGHEHVGTIEAGTYAGTLSGDVNIRDVPNQRITVGPAPRIGHLLPLSRVNKVKIREEFLTGDFSRTTQWLVGRVVMPLHKLVTFENDVAIQWDKGSSAWVDVGTVTGVTMLTYDTTGPITIPGVPTPITADMVTMKYIPPTVIWQPHGKHAPLEHANGFAPIFNGKKPKFRTADAYDGTKARKSPLGGHVTGVDPVICSQGGGCDPNDVGCTNCDPTDPNCGEG
jgi:hypothetical protein